MWLTRKMFIVLLVVISLTKCIYGSPVSIEDEDSLASLKKDFDKYLNIESQQDIRKSSNKEKRQEDDSKDDDEKKLPSLDSSEKKLSPSQLQQIVRQLKQESKVSKETDALHQLHDALLIDRHRDRQDAGDMAAEEAEHFLTDLVPGLTTSHAHDVLGSFIKYFNYLVHKKRSDSYPQDYLLSMLGHNSMKDVLMNKLSRGSPTGDFDDNDDSSSLDHFDRYYHDFDLDNRGVYGPHRPQAYLNPYAHRYPYHYHMGYGPHHHHHQQHHPFDMYHSYRYPPFSDGYARRYPPGLMKPPFYMPNALGMPNYSYRPPAMPFSRSPMTQQTPWFQMPHPASGDLNPGFAPYQSMSVASATYCTSYPDRTGEGFKSFVADACTLTPFMNTPGSFVFPHGCTFRYSCESGYQPIQNLIAIACVNGRWSERAQCVKEGNLQAVLKVKRDNMSLERRSDEPELMSSLLGEPGPPVEADEMERKKRKIKRTVESEVDENQGSEADIEEFKNVEIQVNEKSIDSFERRGQSAKTESASSNEQINIDDKSDQEAFVELRNQ